MTPNPHPSLMLAAPTQLARVLTQRGAQHLLSCYILKRSWTPPEPHPCLMLAAPTQLARVLTHRGAQHLKTTSTNAGTSTDAAISCYQYKCRHQYKCAKPPYKCCNQLLRYQLVNSVWFLYTCRPDPRGCHMFRPRGVPVRVGIKWLWPVRAGGQSKPGGRRGRWVADFNVRWVVPLLIPAILFPFLTLVVEFVCTCIYVPVLDSPPVCVPVLTSSIFIYAPVLESPKSIGWGTIPCFHLLSIIFGLVCYAGGVVIW